ncbi:plasminogen activator inhibitor 2, macrophage [Helicoverpa armigera]|uniref:Serine protease inhibitor 10 n=1 Tax=Helicoverpa armigera TaxID=29058 RepID=A0A1L5J030_HELAM|nr:plasminogen activator inhibitor 2, macrophage [Helicoverpa armigera]APM86798.1 serine protease inhibitor 10 [Helicoverpa armigera]
MRPLLLVLFVVGLSSARWLRGGRSTAPKDTSFVGEATSELSTAIFQGYIDDDKNIAFSPLGYSAILAILAEGARGETREQLVSALHLPQDPNLTRKTYRFIMERLKNNHEYKYNQPELKNYFYIYKNYTINDDYKKILEDYYLTEVRSVERYNPEQHMHDDEEDKGEFTIEISDKTQDNKNEEIPEMMPPKETDEKLISFAVDDIPEKVDISHMDYKPAKNIKEKIKLVKTFPKKTESEDDEETMVAVEARNHARSLKTLNEVRDVSSSLSVNSVGKKSTSISDSLMIIFNGMYFRGSWKTPFDFVEPGVFYKSNTEKKQVTMMKARGTYKTGSLPELDAEAIKLPYDGGRYALLLVVPRTRDGLTRLTADLPITPLSDIQESLQDEQLQISIPTFSVETTTKPVAALAKFGVSNIFSRDADLTGVSSDEGLFVQELVQHVAVRVDDADSSASQIAAANPVMEMSKNLPLAPSKPLRKFNVEHPFIFYILDTLDNLVVVAGKVIDPEKPFSIDDEVPV